MSEVQYKLIYFNVKGRAECIRYIFHLAGVEYEEIRYGIEAHGIPGETGFSEAKENGEFVFGALPVLDVTVNGKTVRIAQSHAIERFLAQRFGLMGVSDVERALIESVQEAALDVIKAYMTEKAKGEEALAEFWANTFPKWIGYLEKMATDNEASQWIVGESVSYADLILFFLYDFFDAQDSVNAALETVGPTLLANRTAFANLDGISQYLAERPPSKYRLLSSHKEKETRNYLWMSFRVSNQLINQIKQVTNFFLRRILRTKKSKQTKQK